MSDEDARVNRDLWARKNSDYTDRSAESCWSRPEITWGLFEIPNAN